MNWVAPRLARRVFVQPLILVLAAAALVLSPAILLATAIVDLVLRRPFATTRLAGVALTHLVFEAFGIVCLFGLWVVSGFGLAMRRPWMQQIHHAFVRWWLGGLIGVTGWLIGIVVEIEDRRPPRPGPILVFSRHAGPWDSFLLAHTLVHGYRRRPRIVIKDTMQWFPVIDITGNRLPNRFIRPHAKDAHRFVTAIQELAVGLGDSDALILFPEGGNFSLRRRLAGIRRLEDLGDAEHAEDARRLGNLIAPRPGGVLAALRGAPDAEVVFVGHTGLEPLSSLGELWDRVPLARPLIGRYWRIPRDEVPPEQGEVVDWLFGWWERIDTWIDQHRGEVTVGSGSPAG